MSLCWYPIRLLRATVLGVAVVLSLAACRGDESNVTPVSEDAAATVGALSTSTPDETATPEAPVVPTKAVLLPAEADAAIVEVALVEHNPWEPAILAQMRPDFSLQADGDVIFYHATGAAEHGWYEAELSKSQTLEFLRRLVNDVGILDLAAARGEPEITFMSQDDGSAMATEAVHVIYVRTAEEEGRLLITQDELESEEGPNSARVELLEETLRAVELWRSAVGRDFTGEEEGAITRRLGWWVDEFEEHELDRAVAIGTLARASTPDDAPAAEWPLEVPLSAAIAARFASAPDELILEGPDVAAVLDAAAERESSIFGPLWADPDSDTPFLVDIRAAPPGVNHVVFAYEYFRPMPSMGLGIRD